jgi:putative FmdB family regulatory protein
MPTYEYACTECGEQLEVVQSFSDDQLTVCPACQGKLRKLFSPVGVVFKGSGFYKTDSRSAAKKKVGASSDSAKSSESSSDSSSGSGDSTSSTSTDSGSTTSTSKAERGSGSRSGSASESKSGSSTGGSDSTGGSSKVA